MKVKYPILLVLIFLSVLGFRLFFEFQSASFSTSDDYFHLREIDSVKKDLKVFYYDPLSYNGRQLYFMPVFYYIMGILAMIFGDVFALKIFPAVISSLVVFAIASIVKEITGRDNIALISAFAGGFLPIFIFLTTNTINPHFMIAPLFLLVINYMIKCSRSKKKFLHLIIFSVILTILHPFSFMIVFASWLYLLLLRIDNIEIKNYFFEYTLFLSFLWYTIYYFIFADGAFVLSSGILSLGMPSSLFSKYFTAFSFVRAFSGVGAIICLLGLYGAYKSISKKEGASANLILTSIFMVIFLFTLLRLLRLSEALSYFGFILVILSAVTMDGLFPYAKKMKHRAPRVLLSIGVVLAILISEITASVYESNLQISRQMPKDTIKAMDWQKNQNATGAVLGNYEEGSIISYFSGMQNVMDTNFGWGLNTQERLSDIKTVYTTMLQTQALEITQKYNIRYIMLTEATKSDYNIESLKFIENSNCFPLIYNNSVQIYRVECNLN